MKNIDFLYFDAGGGHRAAATALSAVAQQQNRDWAVRLVHLQEQLDSLDIFRQLTGLRLEDVYNLILKKGWTLGSAQLMRPMQWLIKLYHPAQVRLLDKFWRNDPRPDLVVSLVPNLNRAAYQGLARARPGVPYVSILTDIADYPPHFWMEKQDQYFICGSDRAVEQALAMGHRRERIFRVSGMILHPRFYDLAPLDRTAERRKLGLDAQAPTAIVLFGGQGSPMMEDIARSLDGTQLIAICGKNEKLATRMRAMKRTAPMHVEGFTREVPTFMRLADLLIGKPGPGSISEALRLGLPVIVERNAFTLPQERYNCDFVVENSLGVVLPNFRDIAAAVDKMLEPEAYARYRAAAGRQDNRAVFEIPDILERICASHSR